MTVPISFTSATARHGLPFLFAGQAQKEFFVNEAHARIDALLHPVIESVAENPPGSPAEGDCWLVGNAPTGAWAGHEGELAFHVQGSWLFAAPHDGMRLFDRSRGQTMYYRGGWNAASKPAAPAGGVTVDAEARAAITRLIEALSAAGILPE